MPTFICNAVAGRLTPVQKTEIARSITNIYHEEFGSPRYFVEVIFHDVAPGNYYLVARPAPADKISITGEIRSGRTDEQRSRMVQRIMQDVAMASGAAEDMVWVHLLESPFADVLEYGRVLVPVGEENAWFSSLPETLQERLKPLA